MTRLRTFTDADGVARAAASDFLELAREAVSRVGRFTVALSGGATPRRLYEVLAGAPYRQEVPWERVEFFWGDERPVPPVHPDSNFALAAETLLRPVGVPSARLHRMEAERTDRDAAARAYQLEIARMFGVAPDGPPPAFDLVLLGLGRDGHTASLFPGSTALSERQRWVVSHFVPQVGADRMTLTVPVLNAAREVRILVAGGDKAAALRAVLVGPRDPERLPAQLVTPCAGRLVWLVDEAAGGELVAAGGSR